MNSQMYWSFAIINNRLAEIYYIVKHNKPNILGHCYIKKTEYKTKQEQLYIKRDTKKWRFTWKHNSYTKVKGMVRPDHYRIR